MADAKISALPASTTPLAGTEVVPLVQSGVTKQVSVANLTAGRATSVLELTATGGLVQMTNAGDQDYRFALPGVVDWRFRANYASGNLEFNQVGGLGNLGGWSLGGNFYAFGNIQIATAGKGIDFSADGSAAGMTSELLDDYEEGTWTPTYVTSGGSFTYSQQNGTYRKIGNMVYVTLWISTSAATVGSGAVQIDGLPFATHANSVFRGGNGAVGRAEDFVTQAPTAVMWIEGQTAVYLTYPSGAATAFLDAADLNTGSGNQIYASFCYPTN